MKKIQITTIFVKILLINVLLTFVNFLLTPSPYSALHSGRTAFSNSESFTINPAYIVFATVFLGWAMSRKLNKIGFLLCVPIFISAIVNFHSGGIYSYLFDALGILFVSSMSRYDVEYESKSKKKLGKDYSIIKNTSIIFCFIGFAMVLFSNGKYGYFALDLSRENRGEITLWVVLCIPLILLSSALIDWLKNEKNKILLAFALIACFITLMTGSRGPLLTYFACIFLFVFGKTKKTRIFLFLIPIAVYYLVSSIWFQQFFFLGNTTFNSASAEEILNGRLDTWQIYWETFVNNWLFGVGPSAVTAKYIGVGSEVGLLKSVAHYGVFWGVIEVAMIIESVKRCISILKNYSSYTSYTLLFVFLFFSNFLMLFQHHSRLLSFSDLIFWYSMFYLCQLKIKSNVFNR